MTEMSIDAKVLTFGRLNTQYRMNESIMHWSSMQFYDGRLIAHHTVKDIKLQFVNIYFILFVCLFI
jgi:superfamily I DNA and/or RNA helicase